MQHICKLTGFDGDNFSWIEIIKEANRKFASTYMLVNDKLEYIETFKEDSLRTIDETVILYETIYSLKAWMPKAGIYKLGETFVYLCRLPKRQWLKSFSLHNNYKIFHFTTLKHVELDIEALYYDSLERFSAISKDREWLIYNNQIVYKYHVVGILKSNLYSDIIYITDPKFYQEVHDKWSKQFKIMLD